MKKFLIAFGVILAVGVFTFFMWDWSVDNKEIKLRTQFHAQVKICQTAHDEMWKVIKQDAELTDKYAKDFEKIFPQLANGMMSDEALFQFLSGFNPQFSHDLYLETIQTLKTERAKFKQAQDVATDIAREYDSWIQAKPTKLFINDDISDARQYVNISLDDVKALKLPNNTFSSYQVLTYKPVTSTKTNDAFEKGVDDDVKLFN